MFAVSPFSSCATTATLQAECLERCTQRTQYPLILWFKVYSLIKGYWDLWVGLGILSVLQFRGRLVWDLGLRVPCTHLCPCVLAGARVAECAWKTRMRAPKAVRQSCATTSVGIRLCQAPFWGASFGCRITGALGPEHCESFASYSPWRSGNRFFQEHGVS